MEIKKILCLLTLILLIVGFIACEPTDPPFDGETRTFYMGTSGGSRTAETFGLAYQNEKANVWIKPNNIGTGYGDMTEALLKHYGDYFKDSSWPDVTTYVYEPQEFFGEENERINIIFYTDYEGIAGYFWSYDFTSESDSNKTNVFYMSIDAATDGDSSGTSNSILFTEGTLTHEFQHMCNAHYFQDHSSQNPLDTWANEMSSILMETMFAGQIDIYGPSYEADAEFKSGVQFIDWENDFSQYTAACLFGTYITSQLATVNQKNLISTLLTNSGSGNTSIHDLVITLEDTNVDLWSSATSVTDDGAVQAKWSELFHDFLTGLIGDNVNYANFISDLSASGTLTISPVTTTSGAKSLDASAWLFAPVKVPDINTTTGCINSSGTDAYMIAYHDGLPAWSYGYQMPDPINTCTISISAKPVDSKISYELYKYNRSMTPVFNNIPVINKKTITEPLRAIVDGEIKYFYVSR
jgi:hypothetical protein